MSQQYPAVIELADLHGTLGFRIDGETENDLAGQFVSGAGDINGDGYADMLVGAPQGDVNGVNSGAAYVVFGGPGSFGRHFDLSALDGANGFRMDGAAAYDAAGFSPASAGDVNGDGFGDVILSALGAETSYVVFGKAGGFDPTLQLADLGGDAGFRLVGPAGAALGVSVASAGDINGDGFGDLVVGAPAGVSAGGITGSSYVVFGHAGGFAPSLDLAALDGTDGFRIDGATDRSKAGASVATAGDVNGDGLDDLIISAPGFAHGGTWAKGAAYVVFGQASGFAPSLDLASLDGTDGFMLKGGQQADAAGTSVASAGDVNGDGIDDIIVGVMRGDADGQGTGEAFVVFGRTTGFDAEMTLRNLHHGVGFELDGPIWRGYAGVSVASAGDVNGDGFDDLIVGSLGSADQAYVVFGKPDGFPAKLDLGTLDGTNGFILSGPGSQGVGRSVASAGDINRDGLDDLMVSAFGVGPNGAAYVIYGQAPTEAVVRVGTLASQSLVGGELADKLSGMAGDDALWGHGGRDSLAGGLGDDTLVGGAGKDKMSGGEGADTFVFQSADDSRPGHADLIRDLAAFDRIDLSAIDADTTAEGDQAFVRVAAFDGHAGQLVLTYEPGPGDTWLEADTDGDGLADLRVVLAGDQTGFSNFVL